jgi:hypothetical protein
MIAATKLLGVIFAVITMLLASLFGVASTISLNSADAGERRDATISVFWSLVVVGLCTVLLFMLSGCQAAKTIIDTCRDGLCR